MTRFLNRKTGPDTATPAFAAAFDERAGQPLPSGWRFRHRLQREYHSFAFGFSIHFLRPVLTICLNFALWTVVLRFEKR